MRTPYLRKIGLMFSPDDQLKIWNEVALPTSYKLAYGTETVSQRKRNRSHNCCIPGIARPFKTKKSVSALKKNVGLLDTGR